MKAVVRAGILVCAFLVAGCHRHSGKESFGFLKAQQQIMANVSVGLGRYSLPKPPPLPVFSRQTPPRQRIEASKAYRSALDHYFGTVIEDCQELEHSLDEAQTQIGGLNATGVEPDVISSTKLLEASLGDMVQILVEIKALSGVAQSDLRQNNAQLMKATLVKGVLEAIATQNLAAGAGTILKGISVDMRRGIEQQEEVKSHFALLQQAIAGAERDSSNAVTKRSELITSFAARYPAYLWASLLPRGSRR